MDDWAACDAEAVVTALSVRYRFSRANAVQLLRDQGILPQREAAAVAEEDDDVEEAEDWESDEEEEAVEDQIIMMPGHELITSSVFAGAEWGHVDGPIADARFSLPRALLQLPDGCLLVGDRHRLRKISADLQQVSTIAGDDEGGHRDGAAAQARFNDVRGFLLLPDGRVLVADCWNHRIRLLSADLQEVSTVAGDGTQGHRDAAAMQAAFNRPCNLAVLHDGRVLVSTGYSGVRILSADLQQVHTVVPHDEDVSPLGLTQLPDGRVVVGDYNSSIRMLEGFPPALMGRKPGAKPPKKKKKKRALAGDASGSSESSVASSSSGPALKRGRSGAGPSNAAEAESSSSEDEGAAAEAEPLV